MYKNKRRGFRKGGKKMGAAMVKRIVKKQLAREIEIKRVDGISNLSPLMGVAAIHLFNGIALGNDDFQRIGNQVTNKYIKCKGDVTFPDSTNKVRVLLLQDKQPNGAFPTIGDLFTFTTQPIVSFLTPDSKARFNVLRDKVYSGGSQGPTSRPLDWYVPLKNTRTVYSAAGDSIVAIRTNAYYLVAISDSTVVPNPVVNLACRIAYTDA